MVEVPVAAVAEAVASHVDGRTEPAALEERRQGRALPVAEEDGRDGVASLVELGCDAFLEVGPKRALTGMMRELAPGRTAVAVGTPALIQELAITA